MIETANEWLKENSNYDVINCETIKIFFKYNDTQNYYDLRYNDISHYIYGSEKNNLLKALRLWIEKKDIENDETGEKSGINLDAGYVTESLSPDTPQNPQESPKLSNLTSILSKRRWTQPQQQLQKIPTTNKQINTSLVQNINSKSQVQNHQKAGQHLNEIHSTDHSPKKNSFQQQQAFRLQQYSSQSKFNQGKIYLNKLQRQASYPQSNSPFQINQNLQSTNQSAQNSPNYFKQQHNQQQQVNYSQQSQQSSSNNQSQQPNQSMTTNQSQKSQKVQSVQCVQNQIKLNYVDIIPECNEINENAKIEKFERLDDCLEKLNNLIRNEFIKGKILSIETSTCEATVDWLIDTESSFTAVTSKNVYFLRCYYIEDKNADTNERIKIMDFLPDHISGGGFFKKPKFQNASLIFPKITEWLVDNPTYKFINAQTLDIKLKNYISQNQTELADTKTMSFTEHGDYLRIVRVVYSEQVKQDSNEISLNEQLVSINQSINNLLDMQNIEDDLDKKQEKNGFLIKQDSDTSGQSGSNDLTKSTNLDTNLDKENRELKEKNDELKDTIQDDSQKKINDTSPSVDCDSLVMKLRNYSNFDSRPIYLTSKLFLSQRKNQTINDLKQEMQDWFKNYQLENCGNNLNTDLIRPKILACETMQIFCKQDDLTNLQKTAEETFQYNRFGNKNGYLMNVFRIYFDLGWFAFERLGYSLKLGNAQKLRRKRLNYSTSVDEDQLKNSISIESQAQKKILNRRESFGDFFSIKKDRNRDQLKEINLKSKLDAQLRRRSCIENSSFEKKSPIDQPMISNKIRLETKDKDKFRSNDMNLKNKKSNQDKNRIDKSTNKFNDKINERLKFECIIDKPNDKSNDSPIKKIELDKDTHSESEFSCLSMIANVSELSKFESSNSSLSTSTISNDELKFINQLTDDKLSLNLKEKMKKFNFRQQSIDNYQNENSNCSLM